MKIVKNLLISLALLSGIAAPAFATVTQTLPPASGHSYGGWTWIELGRVNLASGTNNIEAMSASGTTWDQGWGGQDPWSNQVVLKLFDNGTDLFGVHVGGAVHGVTSFNYTAGAAELQGFNTTLEALAPGAHDLTMRMYMVPVGYPGWQLHVSDATFTVASGVVPEPGSLALFGLALVGFAAARRKFSQ